MCNSKSRVLGARSAAIGAAVALAAGTLLLGPASLASAAPSEGHAGGSADAVVLKTGLDVSLANKSVQLPLKLTLNEVHAPANADKTLLSGKLDGVDHGRPFNVLKADVATSKATADDKKAEGYANLVKASVHVPGLPQLGVIKIDEVTSKATCATGAAPTAGTNFVGDITVLGKTVKVRAGGSVPVKVAGVGEVDLEMAKTVKTSSTAASTALQLKVHINPGNLNVAEVTGGLTLVKASCQTPGGDGTGTSGGDSSGGDTSGGDTSGGDTSGGSTSGGDNGASAGADGGTKTQTGTGQDLAETGGSSSTGYIAGGAAVLVLGGGAAVYMTRRKKAAGA